MDDLVDVNFILPSGLAVHFSLNRGISATSLYAFALNAVNPGGHRVRLVLGTEVVIWGDHVYPLIDIHSRKVDITVVRLPGSGGSDVRSFLQLIRTRCWGEAFFLLSVMANPAQLVRQRDFDDTAVAWAAYRAGSDHLAFELLVHMIKLVPSEVCYRHPGSGFLPLHEAAWGNASPAVAVFLCAAYPKAVFQRSRSGETAHEVGRYYHRNFAWPEPETLLEIARSVREGGQLASALARLRRRSCALSAGLGLPRGPAAAVDAFLGARLGHSDVLRLISLASPRPWRIRGGGQRSSPAADGGQRGAGQGGQQPPAAGERSPAVGARGRRPLRAAGAARHDCEACTTDGVEMKEDFWEPRLKERGRLAGARRVRHRRCSFQAVATVLLEDTGALHRLRLHMVSTVNAEVQRGHLERKWPSKAAWRRERGHDRTLKLQAAQW